MRSKILLVIGALVMLFGPSTAQTQIGVPAVGGAAPGGRGNRGRMDPSQVFDRLAAGREVWVRSELASPIQQTMFDQTAQRLGISTGQITREQFVTGMQQFGLVVGQQQGRRSTRAANASSGRINTNAFVGQAWQSQRWQVQPQWESLSPWSSGLTNSEAIGTGTDPGKPATKLVVYRGDNLPQELDWFRQLDTDHDGQIGLYEWKASLRSIAEFEKLDLNGDGFITAEEALKYQAKTNATSKANQQVSIGQRIVGQRGNRASGDVGPQGSLVANDMDGTTSSNGPQAAYRGNNRRPNGLLNGGNGRRGNQRGGQRSQQPDGS